MSAARRYVSFLLLAAALDLAPGPDILFVFAQSLAQGQAAGACVTFGLCTGLCVHVALAACGFAAVMGRHPRIFGALTLGGALYLAGLGWGAWRAAAVVPAEAGAAEALPYARLYLRGIVMNLSNPKVMLFFLALVPRFVLPERGRPALQFVLLGLTFILSTLLVFNLVSLGGGSLAAFLARWPSSPAFLNRFSAFVMWGLSLWIAVTTLRNRGAGRGLSGGED